LSTGQGAVREGFTDALNNYINRIVDWGPLPSAWALVIRLTGWSPEKQMAALREDNALRFYFKLLIKKSID
jgi:hypothetical protein